ncbi:MAG: hypothetical protein PHV05_06185 [Candidatus Riflebacteria bacterium]|nr:hypothetical protein [Candidatus Riflebacteria bacterium]
MELIGVGWGGVLVGGEYGGAALGGATGAAAGMAGLRKLFSEKPLPVIPCVLEAGGVAGALDCRILEQSWQI